MVFVKVENCDYDVLGIFSFDKKEIIFPFIIDEIRNSNENGFIHLLLNKRLAHGDWDLANMGGNPDGVHCYLNKDGSFFQNEGEIEEKISSSIYILNEGNSTYKLYDCNSDIDNHIVLSDINCYEHHSEFNLLSLETTDSVGIYDLLKNELIFSSNSKSYLEVINNNFFFQSFNKFKKVINRNGETLIAYSILSESYQEIIEVTKNENHYIDKEREYYELNLQNEFYRFEKDEIIFNNDFITIMATDLQRGVHICINILNSGDVKILDVDLKQLNSIVNDLWHYGSEKNKKELETEIKRVKQKGINFRLYNFFEEINIKNLPFNVAAIEYINKVKEKKERLNKFGLNNNSTLNEEIISEIGNKYNNDSYFILNREGDIEHLLMEYMDLFSNK